MKEQDVISLEFRQNLNATIAKLLIEQDALPDHFHWAKRMQEGEMLHEEFGNQAIEIFSLHERRRKTS